MVLIQMRDDRSVDIVCAVCLSEQNKHKMFTECTFKRMLNVKWSTLRAINNSVYRKTKCHTLIF